MVVCHGAGILCGVLPSQCLALSPAESYTWKSRMSANIRRQEELIAQKKREIEAKMADQAKRNRPAPAKPLPVAAAVRWV